MLYFYIMITVKEIARLAGVSAKTAERALSGATKDKRRDARERAQRVRAIAAAHGYQPSELALALRRGSTCTIGFLSDILTDQFLAASVETAMDEAGKKGYKIALRLARFDKKQTEEELKAFLASGVDGIITSCVSEQLPPGLAKILEKRFFPILTLCGRSSYKFSSLSPDYSSAMPQALQTLAEKGHKKVVLCLFDGKKYDNERTVSLFENCCKKAGIKPIIRIHTNLQQAKTLAEEKVPAVILYGKYSMRVFLDRCAELQFQPDVIGIYNEWTLAGAIHFPLLGIILEQAENSVRRAVQQILAQREEDKKYSHIKLPAHFVKKEEFSSLKIPDLTNQRLFDYQ